MQSVCYPHAGVQTGCPGSVAGVWHSYSSQLFLFACRGEEGVIFSLLNVTGFCVCLHTFLGDTGIEPRAKAAGFWLGRANALAGT